MKHFAACFCVALVVLACIFGCSHAPVTTSVEMKSYCYAVKGGDSLFLDIYALPFDDSLRPVICFQFGGGWQHGHRMDAKALCEPFAALGYVAVGMDYRLGWKKAVESGIEVDSTNISGVVLQAIGLGVEDFYDATAFLIRNHETLGIDTGKIVISGASAGAINCVVAEYNLCNGSEAAVTRLPRRFNYAAVVPFAGGLWKSGTGLPQWDRQPCPFLIYHGCKDYLVPFDSVTNTLLDYGMFGPACYTEQLERAGVSFLRHDFEECGHEVSMFYELPHIHQEMLGYLERCFNKTRFAVYMNDSP